MEFPFYTSAHNTHSAQNHKDNAATAPPCLLLLNIFPYKRTHFRVPSFVILWKWQNDLQLIAHTHTAKQMSPWTAAERTNFPRLLYEIKVKSIDVVMLFHFINGAHKVQCVPFEFIFLWLFDFNILVFNRGMDASFSWEKKCAELNLINRRY